MAINFEKGKNRSAGEIPQKSVSQFPAAIIDITEANLSLLRSGKVKGVRFETLAKICQALDCRPGDLLDIERTQGD